MEPETRYARPGSDRIAYKVVGRGPVDVVAGLETFSPLDAMWALPAAAAASSWTRLMAFWDVDSMGAAGRGEIPASRTVRDLVVGSDFGFADWGSHRLKGMDDERQLFALSASASAPS